MLNYKHDSKKFLFNSKVNDCYLSLQYIIFLDTEGTPIQELAAVEANTQTREIVDVFLGHAMTNESDQFARDHIHGLNLSYLEREGFDSENELLLAFKDWLAPKSFSKILSNGVEKEQKALNIKIDNFPLLPWSERGNEPSHQLALKFKKSGMSIMGQQCSSATHSSYISALFCKNQKSYEIKSKHKYHCALYDAYELYLHYMFYEPC